MDARPGSGAGGDAGDRPPAVRPPLLLIVLLTAPLLLGGCISAGDLEDVQETMVAEIRTVEATQDSLVREMRSLRLALLDSLTSREREALVGRGELNRRVQQLEERIARLTALVGESQRTLTSLREDLARRPAGGAPAEREAGASDPEADSAAVDTAGERTEPASDGDPRELYRASLQQYRRGSFATARSGLEEFLGANPDHELAPDAQFYVAETYAEANEYDEALEEYARVLQLYPGSSRAPASLYKSGRVELERGNIEDAREFFSRVVRGYPDSDEAALARDQLDRLGGS